MKLLADENVPFPIIEELRSAGNDVLWVAESDSGLSDPDVLHRARTEERILITFDKEFGTLAFQTQEPPPPGILLFRLPPLPKDALVQFVVETVEQSDWRGQFAVVEHHRIRTRPLPPSS